jgi:8-amino-7-oxononanoate synthase
LHSVIAVNEAFNYLAAHPELQKDIHSKIAFFRNELLKTAASSVQFEYIESQSPIQVVKTGGNIHTRSVAERLQKKGFDVRPILSPTVKEGEERLRICLHTYNTFEEIHKLVQELVSLSTNYTILSDNLLPTPNS